MDEKPFLHSLRAVLIGVDIFGTIFAFASAFFLPHAIALLFLFLLSIGLCIWVQAKSGKHQAIQLPPSPNDSTPTTFRFSSSTNHHGLIAVADLVLGAVLLSMHIVIVCVNAYGPGGILSTYASFAMLLSALLHFRFFIVHIKAWRRDRNKNQPRCSHCRQRMRGEEYTDVVAPAEEAQVIKGMSGAVATGEA